MKGRFITTTILEYINENKINMTFNTNFYKWFNDSKIVDNNNQPMVVYHGSREDFDEFYNDTFFTDDFYNADGYAGGEYVYEVYLSIKTPLIVECNGMKWDNLNSPYGSRTTDIIGKVDRDKYDGIIFTNIKDSWIDDVDYQEASNIYVAFNPNQIKSTDNNGSWSITNNNIYL